MARQAKPARRKSNTGTIRQRRGRDLPWEAAFPLGHDQYRYDSFATREEAGAHLDRLTKERDDQDKPRDIATGSQRFDVFGTYWLDTKKGRIKETSWYAYRYFVELAIEEWKARRMDSIRRPDADALLTYFGKKDFKNVGQLRTILFQLFKYAVEVGARTDNPFTGAKAPTMEHRKAIALTVAQRKRLLQVAAELERADLPLLPAWYLYSKTGLRCGEVLGLRWQDVNWDEGTITIAQQYTRADGKTIKSTPKTKRSTRIVPVGAEVIAALRLQRDRQRLIQGRAETWADLDLVFTRDDGNMVTAAQIWTAWEKIRAAAELPPGTTIHDLRHTASYLMEKRGVPLSSRMALLGHATAVMAAHYSDHADMDAMREAVEKMG